MKALISNWSDDYPYQVQMATLKRDFKKFRKGLGVVIIKEFRARGIDKVHFDVPGMYGRYTVPREFVLLNHP